MRRRQDEKVGDDRTCGAHHVTIMVRECLIQGRVMKVARFAEEESANRAIFVLRLLRRSKRYH